MNENSAKLIEEILDEFDFNRVHKAMCVNDWHWVLSLGTPSIAEMRECAKALLTEVVGRGHGYVATGGFKADIERGELRLVFEFGESSRELEPTP